MASKLFVNKGLDKVPQARLTTATIFEGQRPAMSKLNLSVAIGDYDRNRPLIDGAVQIDGVDPVFMKLYPEEIFFRAFPSEEFAICECSLSSFSVKTAAATCPDVAVPAFVSRLVRHTSTSCR